MRLAVALGVILGTLAQAASALAQGVVLQNDSFAGGTGYTCNLGLQGDEGFAAKFTASPSQYPYVIQKVRVLGCGGLDGGYLLTIYQDDGGTADPGSVIFSGTAYLLDGSGTAFSEIDLTGESIPPITSGSVRVLLSDIIGTPMGFGTDQDGIQARRNYVQAADTTWSFAEDNGATGDWILRLVIQPSVTPVGRLELSHGFVQLRDFGVQPSGVPVHDFRIRQQPFSSYEVVVDSASGDLGPGLILRRLAANGSTILQDAAPVSSLNFAQSLRWSNAGGTAVEDQLVRIQSASCTTTCGPDDVYRVRAYETTYHVPRFNDSGTQVTILLLQNTGDDDISGNVYFWGATGALLGSSPFSLPARATLGLNTSTVPGVAQQSGTLTVAHNGRYGSLAGKAVSLEAATGFSFDTPLEPRAH